MRLYGIIAAALLLILAGCDSDSAADALECSLEAGPGTLAAASTVDFEVTLSGEGDVDTITYQFGDDSQTVTNPTLPWTVTRQAGVGEEVSLTTRGRVTDGRLASSIEAVGTQGGAEVSLTLTDECQQSL